MDQYKVATPQACPGLDVDVRPARDRGPRVWAPPMRPHPQSASRRHNQWGNSQIVTCSFHFVVAMNAPTLYEIICSSTCQSYTGSGQDTHDVGTDFCNFGSNEGHSSRKVLCTVLYGTRTEEFVFRRCFLWRPLPWSVSAVLSACMSHAARARARACMGAAQCVPWLPDMTAAVTPSELRIV